MSTEARLRSGDVLQLVEFDGKLFQFVSAKAHAPGQPLVLDLALGSGVLLDLKSIGSVRREDGTFTVRARAATLSRHAREALDAHFARPA